MSLLGLRNQNLPPFREAQLKCFKCVKKMVELIKTAGWTQPKSHLMLFVYVHKIVFSCKQLNIVQWEDDMTYPVIEYNKFGYQEVGFGINLVNDIEELQVSLCLQLQCDSSKYQIQNISISLFNFTVCYFWQIYFKYKSELTKVNLFDEACLIRAQELVKENELLLEDEGFTLLHLMLIFMMV